MLNNEFPPLGGGTGTVNLMLLRQFASVHNLTIDLITSARGRYAEEERFAAGIRLFKVPVNNRNIHHSTARELLMYAFRAFPLAFNLHRNCRYDLCFAWSAVPAGLVAFLLRAFTRCSYIVRVCGPDIPGFERRYRLLYPMLSPVVRMIWRASKVVVAKCEGEANMIRAVDSTVPLSIIANGVDIALFSPALLDEESGPLRILCVGRLIERKGQGHLIEAVKRLVEAGVDVILTLVGTGDALSLYQSRACSLGIADRVRFVGYVPREEIPMYYAAAHVFVLPSYNEGMSVATLEAMAAGLPLVITRTGGSAELVEEGVNGFTFAWSDFDTLTMYLQRLASDHAMIRRMGAASRKRAAQFAWESIAVQYLNLFGAMTNALQEWTEDARVNV
ncbi:MAG: glycosyltransferase family 4 protein [Candidatus Binatia bacterium]